MSGVIPVFTDGGRFRHLPFAAWAWLIPKTDGKTFISQKGVIAHGTQHTGEIQAAIQVISFIKERFGVRYKILLHTDSSLLASALNGQMEVWSQMGWRRRKGRLANKAHFQTLYELVQGLEIEVREVKSHSGIHWNEVVDSLVKKALWQHWNNQSLGSRLTSKAS